MSDQHAQPDERDLPRVEGRLDRTLADFERACFVLLRDEQERPNPDTALISVLCDAVRLAREQSAGAEQERARLHSLLDGALRALKGVVRVADRKTDEFDFAKSTIRKIEDSHGNR